MRLRRVAAAVLAGGCIALFVRQREQLEGIQELRKESRLGERALLGSERPASGIARSTEQQVSRPSQRRVRPEAGSREVLGTGGEDGGSADDWMRRAVADLDEDARAEFLDREFYATPVDPRWVAHGERVLRPAAVARLPEGGELHSFECRSGVCRVDVECARDLDLNAVTGAFAPLDTHEMLEIAVRRMTVTRLIELPGGRHRATLLLTDEARAKVWP